MTGYGKCVKRNELIEISVEIKTLNGKALRTRFSIPRIFNPFLNEINALVSKYIKRGDVDLYLYYRLSPDVTVPISVNYAEAVKYVKAAERIGAISGREIQVSLKDLLSIPEIFVKEELEVEPFKEILLGTIECALKELDSARKAEGEKLKNYFLERLERIESTLLDLEKQVEEIEEKLFQKLKEKVQKLLKGDEFPEDFTKRLELEVAFLAEKQDVSEEISRLKAHISRFRELLKSEEPVGKTLDFLCQEMHREINTLGNKIKEIDVTDPVIAIKTEIARIKEQVQNVE
ncbi:YicC/YloC family endoribonuclease [Phorcysia thermohydrogeniphila]|nr:YicC/YloC family endoribonuclease [Phorcysia thermohydrogeniphila]